MKKVAALAITLLTAGCSHHQPDARVAYAPERVAHMTSWDVHGEHEECLYLERRVMCRSE